MSLRLDFIGYFDVKKHLIQAGEFEAAGRFDYDAGGILAYGKLCAGIGNCLRVTTSLSLGEVNSTVTTMFLFSSTSIFTISTP